MPLWDVSELGVPELGLSLVPAFVGAGCVGWKLQPPVYQADWVHTLSQALPPADQKKNSTSDSSTQLPTPHPPTPAQPPAAPKLSHSPPTAVPHPTPYKSIFSVISSGQLILNFAYPYANVGLSRSVGKLPQQTNRHSPPHPLHLPSTTPSLIKHHPRKVNIDLKLSLQLRIRRRPRDSTSRIERQATLDLLRDVGEQVRQREGALAGVLKGIIRVRDGCRVDGPAGQYTVGELFQCRCCGDCRQGDDWYGFHVEVEVGRLRLQHWLWGLLEKFFV